MSTWSAEQFINQVTGNIPKAILCVPNFEKFRKNNGDQDVDKVIKNSDDLFKDLIEAGNATEIMASFKSLTNRKTTETIQKNNYLALEVQYNPSSIYLETVAGKQMNFSPVNMGEAGTNQLRQNTEPEATTMSVQLLFDAVNAQDSFMDSNLALTAGNLVTAAMDIGTWATGKTYSVKPQMDGIMSLLTREVTRHVLFFWSKMCFQGELSNVSSHYTMFNTSGNPVRGEVRLTIRQQQNPKATSENSYWEKAFTKAFGASSASTFTKATSDASSVFSNSVLNLNL